MSITICVIIINLKNPRSLTYVVYTKFVTLFIRRSLTSVGFTNLFIQASTLHFPDTARETIRELVFFPFDDRNPKWTITGFGHWFRDGIKRERINTPLSLGSSETKPKRAREQKDSVLV